MTAKSPFWIPIGTFLLAVSLSLLAGPGLRYGLVRAQQDPSGCEWKTICVKVIVLGDADQGKNKGKGGSALQNLTEADRGKIDAMIQVARSIWAKCCIDLKFDKTLDIRMLPATSDMIGDDGAPLSFTEAVLGHFFLKYREQVSTECLNLVVVRNATTGTMGTDDMNLERIRRSGNLSTLPDGAVNDAAAGGQTAAHEIGHQFTEPQVLGNDPDPEAKSRLMWENAVTRVPLKDGGARLTDPECRIARDRIDKGPFDVPSMMRWLVTEPLAKPPGGRSDPWKQLREELERDLKKLEKAAGK